MVHIRFNAFTTMANRRGDSGFPCCLGRCSNALPLTMTEAFAVLMHWEIILVQFSSNPARRNSSQCDHEPWKSLKGLNFTPHRPSLNMATILS
ncbi:hypothetical protein QJS04_geneDACA012490 [Acorus gramineus]|uniref:Uncharacterized protein n=1 Tax=Acorus gramineus TaxID=55184 RepID=A0AAV9BDH8_ACOGR|nr:hypothetical protein QJS04_geneDACA012490 [Acorus gramineus]